MKQRETMPHQSPRLMALTPDARRPTIVAWREQPSRQVIRWSRRRRAGWLARMSFWRA
jgi:hypothetical protein